MKIGISPNVKSLLVPVHGLRHPSVGDTTGWYIWVGQGEPSDPDCFVPLHMEHVAEWRPELPPGWRFLADGTYEDVWYDGSL